MKQEELDDITLAITKANLWSDLLESVDLSFKSWDKNFYFLRCKCDKSSHSILFEIRPQTRFACCSCGVARGGDSWVNLVSHLNKALTRGQIIGAAEQLLEIHKAEQLAKSDISAERKEQDGI